MARLYEEGLIDHVLQWSIGDISTENLFVNQVRQSIFIIECPLSSRELPRLQ
jgi:hypothetical protein